MNPSPVINTAGTPFSSLSRMPKQIAIRPTEKTTGTVFRLPYAAGTADTHSYSKLSPSALQQQARLRQRWPEVVARARELETIVPDPIQAMIQLLSNLPGDYATWREIVEEPYG
jgi:hypothetical protein